MRILLLAMCLSGIRYLSIASQIDTFFLKKINEINTTFTKRVKDEPRGYSYQEELKMLIGERKAMLTVIKLHFMEQLQCSKFVWSREKDKEREESYRKLFGGDYTQDIKKIGAFYQKKINTVEFASEKIKKYSYHVFLESNQNIWITSGKAGDFDRYIKLLSVHIKYLENELAKDPLKLNKTFRLGRSKSRPTLPTIKKEKNIFDQLSKSFKVTRTRFFNSREIDFNYFS